MNTRFRSTIRKVWILMLFIGVYTGIFFVIRPQEAKADATCHVSYTRYTRAEIKFYYYPSNSALGGGLMYKDDGTPTFCIWWSGKTVTDYTLSVSDLESIVSNEDCLEGLYIIMQNGYSGGTDYTVAGIDLSSYGSSANEREELAYYATSWAIHLWMGRYGYENTRLVKNTANAMSWDADSLRTYGVNGKVSTSTMGASSYSQSKAAWKAAMELLALAVEGESRTATAAVSVQSQTEVGNNTEIILKITTENADGWVLTYDQLPSGSSVSKTSGTASSDTVIVQIPLSVNAAAYEFTVTPTASGRAVADSYEYITGTGNLQSLVTWNANISGIGIPASVQVNVAATSTAVVTLTKADDSIGDLLSGAVFTIQERVNGTWRNVGTLTQGSEVGVYDTISVTSYYDSSGNAFSYSPAKSELLRTQYNSGDFRIIEGTAPTGYIVQADWAWYIHVVSEGSWNSVSLYEEKYSGSYQKVGYPASSSAEMWTYVRSGHTAGYDLYAQYNNAAGTANAAYNYGTYVANAGQSASAVTLTKVDALTGEALSGVEFKIQEYAAGAWRDVGTLSESDTDGTYSVVSVQCHYNSAGEKKTLETAQTTLVYTSANQGKYRILELSVPAGYTVSAGWAWYLRVIPDTGWSSMTNAMYSRVYTGSSQVIGYPEAGSSVLWTYVKGGYAADYATYAQYDNAAGSANSSHNREKSLGNMGVTADISLSKADNSTGDLLSGAVFTIYERIGDNWMEAGVLTEGSTAGTYNVISLSTLHDSSGNAVSVSKTALVYTNSNQGYYKVVETTPPTGFEQQTDWVWYIRVVPATEWETTSITAVLGGSNSGTYIIGKLTAWDTVAWHYIKSGSTAYYSHYATYDTTDNALFNYGTKLGNTPKGIDVSLTKIDYVTGEKLTGAVFSIEEKVNGSWYEVGTLTDSGASPGVYTVISVTKHYDENGKEVQTAETQDKLYFTQANGGEYRIKEITPPDNYEIAENWCWYVTVVKETEWPAGSSTTGLSGTLLATGSNYGSDTWKIMKISGTKAVQYVVQGATAYYQYYAMYDVNANNKLVAGSATSYRLSDLGITAGISLNKIDYHSEEPLSGVTFAIQEYVNDTWYTVGTLSESQDTAGTYDVVSVTKHYYVNSAGKVTSRNMATADEALRYTTANGGFFRVIETAVPTGYQLAEDWAWYVQVVSDDVFDEVDGYGTVLGEDETEGYKVVGMEGTVFAIYSVTDNSLTFYFRTTSSVPTVNSTFNGKAVTAIYTGFETKGSYVEASRVPWNEYASSVKTVTVADYGISPRSLAFWFCDFTSCTSMDLAKLDTSGVSSLKRTFMNCSSLKTLDISTFDTSGVTNMERMFSGCSSLQSLDVTKFDTSNVTNMPYMFESCSTLTSLDVTKFDTSEVTSMQGMFSGCSGLTSLNVKNYDTSNVRGTGMTGMFYGCSGLTSLDLSNFNTEKVTSLGTMFLNCSSLTSLNLSSFDTSKVTTMNMVFYGCSSLTSLDLSSFNTANVTELKQTFSNCSSLKTIYVSYAWSIEKVESNDSPTFDGCTSLVGGSGTVYTSLTTSYTYAKIDGGTSSPGLFTYKAAASTSAAGSEEEILVSDAGGKDGMLASTDSKSMQSVSKSGNSFDPLTKETSSALVVEEKETVSVQASASGEIYPMVIHFIRADETAYYSDYAACDTTIGNVACNYELADGEWVLANTLIEIRLRLTKRSSTGATLAGAEFTIQELVGSTWYDIGTLTSSNGNYLYDTVNITCHYDENGNKITLANAQAGLVYLAANSGKYRVIETKAPSGYYCPTPEEWSWDLTLTETILTNQTAQTTTATNTTLTQTAVSVRKVWDDQNDYAGKRPSSITVYLLQNGKVSETVTLNEDNEWSYSWTGLSTKYTWTVQEAAVSGYSKTSTVTENGYQISYVLTNKYTPTTTSVTAQKVWEDEDDAAGLRPVSIKVSLYADGEKLGDSVILSADNGWKYTWTGLKRYRKGSTTSAITYTVAEEEVDGYIQTKSTATGSAVTITMTNTITKVSFLKVDADGNAVSGAVLRIVDSSENTVEEWTTDGTAHVVYGMKPGTYTLVEAGAPDGYIRSEAITFTLGEDGVLEDGSTVITMTDENTSVKFAKTDAQTGESLAGAKLSIINVETGREVLSWVSGDGSTKASSITISSDWPDVEAEAQEDGSILAKYLPAGEYILTETEAPDGFKVAEEVTFTVATVSSLQTITVEDERYRELHILKTDADGNAISGATLALYQGSLTEPQDEAFLQMWKTDGTAHVIENIDIGTYTVFELYTPEGYVTSEPIVITILEESKTVEVVMKDEPIEIVLQKIDKGSGEALAGAVLTLRDVRGNAVVSFVSGDSKTSASSVLIGDSYKNRITVSALSDGSLQIRCLPAGDYILEETEVPPGYVSAEKVYFTVTETAEVQRIVMEDDYIKVQISKTDLTTGQNLANATLAVTDEAGETVLTWTTGSVIGGNASITSVSIGSAYEKILGTAAVVNAEGNWAIEVDYLPTGTYTLTEMAAPDGYVLTEAVEFTVTETGEIQTVEMQDDVTKLLLFKIEKGTLSSEIGSDGETSWYYTAVAGATLVLNDSAGNLIVRFLSGDAMNQAEILEIGDVYRDQIRVETPSGGGLEIFCLPAGISCTLTEEEASEGYIAGADVTFTTKDSAKIDYVFMENDYTKIAVWKVDEDTGEELPGALLQILNENGDVVAEWMSGSEEFVLDANGEEILVDSEGNVLGELRQEMNADGTVTIYDEEGNVVTDVTRLSEFVKAGAPHEIDFLAAGKYTLHEVSAPEGYEVAGDIAFEIAADGTVSSLTQGVSALLEDGIYTITMKDSSGVPIYISKVDENGDPQAGAVLVLYEGDVTTALQEKNSKELEEALVERWTTDGTEHLIEHVKAGTYTLVEESAPDGYTLADAMVITVESNQGEACHFTVVNSPVAGRMPSTGGAGTLPLIALFGSLFLVLGAAVLVLKALYGKKAEF